MISTDSRPLEDPKDTETDHLYQLFSLFGSDEQKQSMADMYRGGGFGYGEVKKAIAEAAENYFAPARERRAELAADLDRVHQVLGDGAAIARKKAAEVLARAKKACGL